MKTQSLIFISLFLSVFSFAQVTVQTNIPASIAPNSDVLIEIKLNKGTISSFSKYQVDVPAGVTVTEGDSKTGNFTFEGSRAKIVWVSIPADPEFIITFRANTGSASGPGTFNQKFYYLDENGKKEVELDPVNVTFDASGAKTLVSMGGNAGSPAVTNNSSTGNSSSSAVTTPSETVSSANSNTIATTTSEPLKTNAEPVKTNTESTSAEPVKTNTEPAKTNTEPVKTEPVVNKTEPAENKTSKTTETKTSESKTDKSTESSSSSAGIVFKVQIGAYAADPDRSLFKGISDKVTVVKDAGFFKALVGNFNTREEAVSKINELKGSGFQGFLVRFQNGVRVK